MSSARRGCESVGHGVTSDRLSGNSAQTSSNDECRSEVADGGSDKYLVTWIEHLLGAVSERHSDLRRKKSVLVEAWHQSADRTLTNQIPCRGVFVQCLKQVGGLALEQ